MAMPSRFKLASDSPPGKWYVFTVDPEGFVIDQSDGWDYLIRRVEVGYLPGRTGPLIRFVGTDPDHAWRIVHPSDKMRVKLERAALRLVADLDGVLAAGERL
jgi:hypothetical protein